MIWQFFLSNTHKHVKGKIESVTEIRNQNGTSDNRAKEGGHGFKRCQPITNYNKQRVAIYRKVHLLGECNSYKEGGVN